MRLALPLVGILSLPLHPTYQESGATSLFALPLAIYTGGTQLFFGHTHFSACCLFTVVLSLEVLVLLRKFKDPIRWYLKIVRIGTRYITSISRAVLQPFLLKPFLKFINQIAHVFCDTCILSWKSLKLHIYSVSTVCTYSTSDSITCGVFSNLIHLFPPQGQNKAYPS